MQQDFSLLKRDGLRRSSSFYLR